MTAAPTPCTNRAAIMIPAEGATPAPSDPKPNSINERLNIRFRPSVSPNRPPSSMNPPNTST